MTGIDTAMPDIKTGWSNHAEWNQNNRLWREDFAQLRGLGFDLLRWGMPWSIIEPHPGVYRWDLLDERVEYAQQLGLELFFPIVHFNYPSWVPLEGERHAVLSARLADRVASYTDRLLARYRFRFVVPMVEVEMDALQRGLWGKWQPHLRSRADYGRIWTNLVGAFRAGAAVAHEYGATVVCSEPAPDIDTVLALGKDVDIAGIDLYPHVHRKRSIIGYLRLWSELSGLPLCLSEFGTPETWDPRKRRDHVDHFVTAGKDDHRVASARLLREALAQASKEGIRIPLGGWYPGTGNIGWGHALTQDRSGMDCDRAGLVDLSRQPDGSLERVVCRELVEEVLGLREVFAPEPERVKVAAAAVPVPAV
jgi:hypothetical protein